MGKIRDFRESRTGAALLMVLLVMVFVVIMGSSVMFTSYNSYMMRLVERAGAETFYSTEELTDLVRVTVQEAASEALETAYTRVMAEYAFIQADCLYDDEAVQEAAQSKFNQYFIEELAKVTVPSADGSGEVHLFQLDSSNDEASELAAELATGSPNITGSYSTSSLGNSLPSAAIDGDASVSGMSGYTSTNGYVGALTGVHFDDGTLSASGTSTSSTDGSAGHFYYTYGDDGYPRLVLEYVTVGYTTNGVLENGDIGNSVGYTTNITTDIIIEMPIFTHTGDTNIGFTGSDGSVEDKNVDAIPFDGASSIGRYWVKHSQPNTSGEFLVTGDLYGGTFYIYNASTVDPTTIEFSHTVGGSDSTGRLITNFGDVIVDDQQINDHYITSTGLSTNDEYLTLDGIGIYSGTSLVTYGEIWTNSITVGQGSDLVLNPSSKTYFKKDITIDGGVESGTYNQADSDNISNITLGGNLIGFSTGSTAETSSAITINGNNVALDMGNMRGLILGGSAYLQIGRSILADGYVENTNYGEYKLGQSIAASPDALAYLVPTGALKSATEITSNPFLTTSGTGFSAEIDFNHSSILVSGMSSMVNSAPQVISRQYKLDGETYYLIYYFYDFIDDSARSKYLVEYNKNSSAFQNNLELYVDFVNTDVEGNISIAHSDAVEYAKEKAEEAEIAEEAAATAAAAAATAAAVAEANPDSLAAAEAAVQAAEAAYDAAVATDIARKAADAAAEAVPTYTLESEGVFYYLDNDGNLQIVNNSVEANEELSGYDEKFFNTSITLWHYLPPNENYTATIYNHVNDGNVKATSVRELDDYLAGKDSTTFIDNPFDYYVNFHGDNLNVNIDYSGALLDPEDVDEDSIWKYFENVDKTEVTDPYTRSGLVSWVSGMNTDGLSYNGTNDYVRNSIWGYEFYLGGPNLDPSDKTNCVAIFTAVGCHLWEGEDPSGDPTANMKTGVIYTDSYPDLHMVLSRAGANVEAEFDGLVFAETGIALTAPINSTKLKTGFIEIMHAYCTLPNGEIRYLYEFFRNLNMIQDGGSGDDGSDYLAPGVSEDDAKVNWKPNDLVYYENWEKH